jgi:hypothetical protein
MAAKGWKKDKRGNWVSPATKLAKKLAKKGKKPEIWEVSMDTPNVTTVKRASPGKGERSRAKAYRARLVVRRRLMDTVGSLQFLYDCTELCENLGLTGPGIKDAIMDEMAEIRLQLDERFNVQ